MNISQLAAARNQEQSAYPSTPPPPVCGWQSPQCREPVRYHVQLYEDGRPVKWLAVCSLHLVYVRVHSATGEPQEVEA